MRLPAHPPEISTEGDHRYIAAIDADAGGTWLAANDHGLVVGILNYYQYQVPDTRGNQTFISRGKLVTSLMACKSPSDAAQQLDQAAAENYRAFILLLFGVDQAVLQLKWNGTTLERSELPLSGDPISTSSFRTEDVLARRQQAFENIVRSSATPDDTAYRAFHEHRETDSDAYSVCMSRDDARTVSFSQVSVRTDEIAYAYYAEGPAQTSAPATCTLPRVESSTHS